MGVHHLCLFRKVMKTYIVLALLFVLFVASTHGEKVPTGGEPEPEPHGDGEPEPEGEPEAEPNSGLASGGFLSSFLLIGSILVVNRFQHWLLSNEQQGMKNQ